MTFQRLEIGVGDHPNLEGPDVLFTDIRDCGIRPLVACDVFAPLPFADGAFTHVASHHVLEHSSWHSLDATLTEWVRVLAPNGTMHLEVPDFCAHARAILADPSNRAVVTAAYGNQDYPENLHRQGLTRPILGMALIRAGLTVASVVEHGGCLVVDGAKVAADRPIIEVRQEGASAFYGGQRP